VTRRHDTPKPEKIIPGPDERRDASSMNGLSHAGHIAAEGVASTLSIASS
jgi:hypothetical protein